MNEIFQDITDLELGESDDEFEFSLDSEWKDVRDDSDMNMFLQDTMDTSALSQAMSKFDKSDQTIMGRSSLLNTLAVEVSNQIHSDDNMESRASGLQLYWCVQLVENSIQNNSAEMSGL